MTSSFSMRVWLSSTALALALLMPLASHAVDDDAGDITSSPMARDDVEDDLSPLVNRSEGRIYETDKMLRVGVAATTGIAYNDNIYRSSNNEKGDFIGIVRPTVRLRSDFKPYILDLQGNVELGEYLDTHTNSYTDADVKGKIGYEVAPGSQVYANGRYQQEHVAIGGFTDLVDRQTAKPTEYDYFQAGTGVKVDQPQWMAHLHGGVDFYDYQNNFRNDGTVIINNDRDRDEKYLKLRAGYKPMPGWVVYGQSVGNTRNYSKRVDSSAVYSRNSDGYQLLAGVKMGERRDPLYFDIGIGYLQQNYDAAQLPKIDGFAIDGEAEWMPAMGTLLRAYINRQAKEVSTDAVSGYLQTNLGVEATRDVLPQVTAGARLGFSYNDFEVNPALGAQERSDRIYQAALFADYNFYDKYTVGAEYQRNSRDSNIAVNDYDANVVLLRLGALY